MSKRRQTDVEDDEDEDEPTPELVDVDFDYYNVNADKDYHAVQRLFTQLFGPDAERVQTGPLTELVLRVAEESGVGSTIKTEEEEGSDPYAVLTVISCRDHAELKTVVDYVLSKTSVDEAFHGTLSSLLENHAECHVGLVLSERLMNVPVQVMSPMYRMLSEEIDQAGEAYQFTHYLFVSRAFRPDEERTLKRHRSDAPTNHVCAFHPEDDAILRHATHAVTYEYTESVGVAVLLGRAMLVPVAAMDALVKNLIAIFG